MNLIDRDSLLEKIQFRIKPEGIVGETVRDMVAKTREIILAEPTVGDKMEATELQLNFNRTSTEWIPVTERLPNDDTKYLVARPPLVKSSGWIMCIAWYDREFGFHEYDSEWGDIPISNVTHWMPLPTPPKGVE